MSLNICVRTLYRCPVKEVCNDTVVNYYWHHCHHQNLSKATHVVSPTSLSSTQIYESELNKIFLIDPLSVAHTNVIFSKKILLNWFDHMYFWKFWNIIFKVSPTLSLRLKNNYTFYRLQLNRITNYSSKSSITTTNERSSIALLIISYN